MRQHFLLVLGALLLGASVLGGCDPIEPPPSNNCPGITCTDSGFCYDVDGTCFLPDCSPCCEQDGTCPDPCELDNSCPPELICLEGQACCYNTETGESVHPLPDGTGPCCEPDGTCGQTDAGCLCDVSSTDADGDCILDSLETAGAVTSPSARDTDGDGIWDGCEDRNRNGTHELGELDPTSLDTDGDGIPDNVEDTNLNGRYDIGETYGTMTDTDGDGIADGDEDKNHNGVVDATWDTNGNGCYDAGVDLTNGETDPRTLDSDGDLIFDDVEDANHNGLCDGNETCTFAADSDCDGLRDGREDLNHNGAINSGETDPLNPDTDGDGLLDGVEDANGNGNWEPDTETSPSRYDSDGDQIPDGVEDRNLDGVWDAFVDSNVNGCFDAGETTGETDPRKLDTDDDGLPDSFEDRNRDGLCDVQDLPNPVYPTQLVRTYVETCAFVADSDCDGLTEGQEDLNRNGDWDTGELDPRLMDTDHDGLTDGCPPAFFTGSTGVCSSPTAEDKNNNGVLDAGETDPHLGDTDGDRLFDGCELAFATNGATTGPTDARREDTDNDGLRDGDEDANRNCQVDAGETDPRVADAPPTPGPIDYVQWSVCGAQNLKALSFVASNWLTHDYRLGLEIEQNAAGTDVPYTVRDFGRDTDADGFLASDIDDELWGHTFQSPALNLTAGSVTYNRDIYGFLVAGESTEVLDDLLDARRNAIDAAAIGTVTVDAEEVGALTARPAHDDLPNFHIDKAQRLLRITTSGAATAIGLRNAILRDVFLGGATPDPLLVLGPNDPVHGNLPPQYTRFSLYIGAVKRYQQQGVEGDPVVVTVVALTPDDSDANQPSAIANTLYADRLTRLEDLTGGSALARYAAEQASTCEQKDPQKAEADLLWVVDDSRSMQQMIGRLQQAAADARAVLTANSNIVDFRVAMTTTNASEAARTQCPLGCDNLCTVSGTCGVASCADQHLDCLKVCPSNCSTTCSGASCPPGGAVCTGTCIDPSEVTLRAAIHADANASDPTKFPLPGGGGTFYFEDSQYLDCIGVETQTDQRWYINSCYGVTSFDNTSISFAPFFDAAGPLDHRKQLLAHAGFLGSAATLGSCDANLKPMDLLYNPTASNAPAACVSDAQRFCERLQTACDDGPTVLASQMCDLIRAMGGLPCTTGVDKVTTGARPHSAPEMGSRSARRLLETLYPALPGGYVQGVDGSLDPKTHLRLLCDKGDAGCVDCPYPNGATCPTGNECAAGQSCVDGVCTCAVVPTVTVFLSDEEDFWLKDECRVDNGFGEPDMSQTDFSPLPVMCRWADGDPATFEACDVTYCEGAGFATQTPVGYDPDQTAWSDKVGNTLKWRTDCRDYDGNNAGCTAAGCAYDTGRSHCYDAACSPWSEQETTSCVGDPCPALYNPSDPQSQSNCENEYGSLCVWTGATCVNRCAALTTDTTCNADAECAWQPGKVGIINGPAACQMRHPLNDCQPCKRLLRTRAAIYGGDGLPGLGEVGPVYAIARDRGVEGFYDNNGTPTIPTDDAQDACAGGRVTWGRGEGQTYRDLAIGTYGRTQNVCSESYRDFMQLVVTDIVALSAPYPLAASPIAATIKVGIARPTGGDHYDYIDVSRARAQGFVYDPTSNSIGFKSDPVDGVCNVADYADDDSCGSCVANGVIESSEICAARSAQHIPRTGDVIFISYRYWRPVPCAEECTEGEACVRVTCPTVESTNACTDNIDCIVGHECNVGTSTCERTCNLGEAVETCVPMPTCPPCSTYNPATGLCIPAADPCACNAAEPGAEICNPLGPDTCGLGYACDETCVCLPASGICGTVFRLDGTVTDCDMAIACCTPCSTHTDQATCDNNTFGVCAWSAGACIPRCETLTDQSSCTSSSCYWNGSSCGALLPQCCEPGETIDCPLDPETQRNFLYCNPGDCECSPACNPTTQYCRTDICECWDNPT